MQCLHLIPTTRSRAKADATVSRLQAHVENLVSGNFKPEIFTDRPSPLNTTKSSSKHSSAIPQISAEARAQWRRRITIAPILLDLCSLPSVYAAAREIRTKYPRLDVLICNAGIGGWEGINWLLVAKQFFTEGLTAIMSRPAYKRGTLGSVTASQVQNTTAGDEEPKLGEVFCANVFGHYLLVHETVGLLSTRKATETGERGRVVWLSSAAPLENLFDATDLQGMKTEEAYESSKRLTDILFLSMNLPETQKWVTSYITPRNDKKRNGTLTEKSSKIVSSPPVQQSTIRPKMYTCHPGMFVSSIMPLYPILIYAWVFAYYLARIVGGLPWIVITPDRGASAPVWLALEDSAVLDEQKADEKKWGSCVFGWGNAEVMETHVDLLGTKGFGELAEGVWGQMEGLRDEWRKDVSEGMRIEMERRSGTDLITVEREIISTYVFKPARCLIGNSK